MNRVYAISNVTPLPVPFKDDAELAVYLGLPDTAEGRALLTQVTAENRAQYASMRAIERELQAGRLPWGVIACSRNRSQRSTR